MVPMMSLLFSSLFGTETKDPVKMKENWIRGYNTAYEEVRRVVPPEKRLEYSLGQGWEPLCEFLGTKVPDKPFPHENDLSAFEDGIKVFIKRMWIRAAKLNAPYAIAALGIGLAWWWYQ